MSKTRIPCLTIFVLWGKAAGRCEYDGCNRELWHDSVTKTEFNTAYVAHIIADQPGGPRGDPIQSAKLKADLSNLMLLCDEHHRLIDREQVVEHPVDRLHAMKEKHERRIEFLGSLTENKQSHVVLYGANIGNHSAPVSAKRTFPALSPHWYPAESHPIEIGLQNSSVTDSEPNFWENERENLRRQFNQKIKTRLSFAEISHLSIFALAPQPLLIEFGRLLSDIPMAQVYQLHREPPNWAWLEEAAPVEYLLRKPAQTKQSKVALVLSLSATITPDRITSVLGSDTAIWMLTIDDPNNDFLKGREHLSGFRQTFRKLLDAIKAEHGQDTVLHIFPAVPVSIAVEIGRVWMPKADLPLRIYDQNRGTDGFTFAFDIIEKVG